MQDQSQITRAGFEAVALNADGKRIDAGDARDGGNYQEGASRRRICRRSYAILGISLSHWNPFGGLS